MTIHHPELRAAAIEAQRDADTTLGRYLAGQATWGAVDNTSKIADFAQRRWQSAERAGPYPGHRAGFRASA